MTKPSSNLKSLSLALLLTLSGGVFAAAAPVPTTVDLSATPPDLTLAVAPNLILTYDDSGSMAVSYVPGIIGDGDPQYGLNAGYIKDPASNGKMCTWYGVTDSSKNGFKDPIPGVHPWAYSAAVNTLYYDPSVTYTPPKQSDGSAMPDSSYTAAWVDGIAANTGGSKTTLNLKTAYQVSWSGSTPRPDVIRYAAASSSSTLCAPARINDKNSADNGLSVGYMPFPTKAARAFYYVLNTGVDATNPANLYKVANYTAVDVGTLTTAQQTNFANWYSYYRSRNLAARSSVSRAFQAIPSNIRVQWQRLNTSGLSNSAVLKSLSDATQKTNFFKFLYASAPNGGTPTRGATERVMRYLGPTNANNDDKDPYYDSFYKKELTCRRNYHLLVTDGGWKDDYTAANSKAGTPEKYWTLNSVANASVAAPNQNADQSSITALPDGRPYDPTSAAAKIFGSGPDQTGRPGFADQAFYYWATPLRTFAKNNVVPYIPDKTTGVTGDPVTGAIGNDPTKLPDEVYFNPANDPATWPHLTQFIVAFGLGGSLNFPGDLMALRKGTKVWTAWDAAGAMNELQDVPEKADDTWHAAINSRGGLFSANNPQQLIDQLLAVINSIVTRETAPVASALNTAVLGVNAVTYVTGFNSTDYSGSVVAKSVDASGNVGAVLWDAAALLDARTPSNRVILTSAFDSTKKLVGTAFTWSATSDLGKNLAAVDSRYTSDGNAQKRTDYLRGVRTDESTTFRVRGSVVGAIIDSQAVYVAYPAAGYSDTWAAGDPESGKDSSGKLLYSYTAFATQWAKRAPTLYVGANDGMLHAFDATLASDKYTGNATTDTVDRVPSPGAERWAYIPNAIFNHLYDLTRLTDFTFIPTVDATPVVRDVFFSSGTKGWHSILLGGLRMGGRGVYALDITDPSASEAGAANKVLWEFNSSVASTTAGNPANLGYTYGRPNVGRLANKKWVVLIPSGYFPTGTDCTAVPAACNTTSSLFVVNAQTGELIKELKTPAGTKSYGLASPVLGDYDSDQVDDVAFAGDLQGQLWRFDLSDADPANWKVDLAYQPSTAHLGNRPITVMPRLFADPNSQNFIVIFGTGKYLGGSDNTIDSTTPVQGVYGIREPGKSGQAAVAESSLIQQTMTEVDSIRGLTTKAVPLTDADGKPYGGWYFDLVIKDGNNNVTDAGERVVVDPTALFDSGRAIITTLIPTGSDPCEPDRQGAVLVVDAATGGAGAGVGFGTIANWPADYAQAGARVTNVPTNGQLPAASQVGGGQIYLPGISLSKSGTTFGFGDAIWRRRSWRVLNNGNN
jgi:type IV pilus assembly protein PilY1